MNKVIVGIAILFAMAATNGGAEEKVFQSRDYGSSLPGETQVDTNGDGRTADLMLVSGTSSELGYTTTQSVLEWSSDPSWTTCPNGNPGLQGQLVSGNAAIHAARGDVLLIRFDRGLFCLDSATNAANINLTGTVVGGIGRFANAKGTVEINGIAIPEILLEKSGPILFSNIDTKTKGVISTPRRVRG
jgi:hypothetical protein